MGFDLNKVQLIGRTGKDAELKYTGNGTAVATFSVATNESYKGNDGNLVEKTEWHNIVCWRKLAENCGEYLKKGAKVYVEGKLATKSWEKEGQKKYITEIIADRVLFLDSKGGASQSDDSSPAVDDIPF